MLSSVDVQRNLEVVPEIWFGTESTLVECTVGKAGVHVSEHLCFKLPMAVGCSFYVVKLEFGRFVSVRITRIYMTQQIVRYMCVGIDVVGATSLQAGIMSLL